MNRLRKLSGAVKVLISPSQLDEQGNSDDDLENETEENVPEVDPLTGSQLSDNQDDDDVSLTETQSQTRNPRRNRRAPAKYRDEEPGDTGRKQSQTAGKDHKGKGKQKSDKNSKQNSQTKISSTRGATGDKPITCF